MTDRHPTADTPAPREVRIGGSDKGELVRALREHDVRLNPAAEALFEDRRFIPLGQCAVVEIAVVSVAELGFGDGATYEQITRRALAAGLVQCPLELGPHLRIQFLSQPEAPVGTAETKHRAPSGAITIASAPIDEDDQTPKGFYLRRADGLLWLRGYWSWPGHIWNPNDVFVFSRQG